MRGWIPMCKAGINFFAMCIFLFMFCTMLYQLSKLPCRSVQTASAINNGCVQTAKELEIMSEVGISAPSCLCNGVLLQSCGCVHSKLFNTESTSAQL